MTYALMNLVVPFFGGVPVCHGCGGLAGHYAFGARTGGSVIIYGSIYVVLGLIFSGAIGHVVQTFPQPLLAVILLFEALTLMMFVRDQVSSRRNTAIALIVGLLAFSVPQGFVVGLLVGCVLYYASSRLNFLSDSGSS
jgi:MFS superfamily sulfate permease-like transporter